MAIGFSSRSWCLGTCDLSPAPPAAPVAWPLPARPHSSIGAPGLHTCARRKRACTRRLAHGLRGDASAEKESFARRSGHTGRERGSIFRLAFAYAYPFSGRAARAPFVGLSNGRGSRGWRGASSRGARSRSMVKRCDGRGSLRGHGRPSGGSGGWRSAQLPAARRVRSPTLRRPARCTRACAPALPSRV